MKNYDKEAQQEWVGVSRKNANDRASWPAVLAIICSAPFLFALLERVIYWAVGVN